MVSILFLLTVLLLMYAGRMPQTHIQRRMGQMIAEAEKERHEAQKAKQRLVAVDSPTVDHRTMAEMSFKERVIQPIISGIEARLMQFAPQELRNMMEQMLFRLGVQEQWSVKRLAAGWVISVSLGFLLAMLIVYKSDLQFSQQVALLALGVTAGMAVGTLALLFVVPAFFIVFQKLHERFQGSPVPQAVEPATKAVASKEKAPSAVKKPAKAVKETVNEAKEKGVKEPVQAPVKDDKKTKE